MASAISAETIFLTASYLTDPVCKAHEFFRRIAVVESLNPTESKISHVFRKGCLLIGLVGFVFLASVTTIPGIVFRSLGRYIQKRPFIHVEKSENEKILPPDRTLSLLSWNICCAGAGYAISDGGVVPWPFRFDALIHKVLEKNADVNCLYEVFDIKTGYQISEKLISQGYSHFYFNIKPRNVGVSSGIMIASKYAIKNPVFIPFPVETLVGRTKNASKGVFAFDLESQGKIFARVVSTHLQHSEQPAYPTDEEIEARKQQMEIVMQQTGSNVCEIVTGDFNLDENEYNSSFAKLPWCNRFLSDGVQNAKTWGGDQFCATLVGKKVSSPLNLDYTLIKVGTFIEMKTQLVETGYDDTKFTSTALSDHAGVLTTVRL